MYTPNTLTFKSSGPMSFKLQLVVAFTILFTIIKREIRINAVQCYIFNWMLWKEEVGSRQICLLLLHITGILLEHLTFSSLTILPSK